MSGAVVLTRTEEQRELAAVLDVFVTEQVRPRLADLVAHDRVPDNLHARLVSQGLWSLGMPIEIGGGGGDLSTLVLTLQRLATGSAALALTVAHAHAAVAVLADTAAGRSAAAEVAAGARAALVDLERPAISAVPQDWDLVVDGTVSRVDAGDARFHALLGPAGAVAVVDPTATGFAVHPAVPRCGLAGATTRAVEFKDCRLAQLPASQAAITRARRLLLLGMAATAAGIADAAASAALGYLAQRSQFGRPLREFPVLRHRLAMLDGQVRTTLDAVVALGAGGPGGLDTSADERDEYSAAADRCASTRSRCQRRLQLHGGYGYLEEYGVERLMRDAVSLRAAVSAIIKGLSFRPTQLG